VGQHYGVKRIPVIKKQAISAYDPRVIEATGITMMVTAQGADHTAGNAPRLKTRTMTPEEIMNASLREQIFSAATDSVGLCVFGRSVTNAQTDFIAEAINDALGTQLTSDFFFELGRETLKLEWEFNEQAGFTTQDDDLPDFFYDEPLPPTDHVARFHGEDVRQIVARLEEAKQ
jgi:aldehyde:ferredoxin oxidoreductase